MQIIIEYEASWRNSFLDSNNNEPLPKAGRKFIGSMTSLNNEKNFIQRHVSLDTVMGLLNRLIGDQRKLYQAREQEDYFFKEIEPLVKFTDKPTILNHETTYIRNITGNTDPKSYSGMVKSEDLAFKSEYSCEFWGILSLELNSLCDFILHNRTVAKLDSVDPLEVVYLIESIEKIKPVPNEGIVNEAYQYIKGKYLDYDGVNNKELVIVKRLYFSALYIQLERLSERYNMETLIAKRGGITGISKNNFTKKNFMGRFATGGEKKVWGNPYVREEFVKGEGKVKQLLTKASGKLEISLDIPKAKGREIKELIDNAGVSSFYLGKKGLAYVSKIRV